MKLFKSLLVAPAALGLLSPLAASANQVNINDISNYSDIENVDLANSFDKEESIQSTLLAGGEGLVETSSFDGGFSDQYRHTVISVCIIIDTLCGDRHDVPCFL